LRPDRPVSALEIVTIITVVFVFGYLVWTLLRPEDF
jgi:K+-transporting ATPase KdpF subunit